MDKKINDKNKPKSKKRLVIRIINIVVVVGFGLFLVYFLLGRINISDIRDAIVGSHKPTLIFALVIAFLSSILRGYRKKILIGSDRIGMGDMLLVALTRNAFNMVLPARTGELSYVYVLQRKFKLPIEIGVSTLLVVLVFDLVIVFSLIVISIVVVLINTFSGSFLAVVFVALALLVILLLVLFYLSKVIGFFLRIIDKIFSRYKIGRNKVVQAVYKKLIDINENIALIQKRKIYWKVYLSSVVIRVLKFIVYYLLILSILRPAGYGFADLSFWMIFLATVAAEISAVLPTHALAGLGTYEGAFLLVLGVLGFTLTGIDWTTVAFSYHIIVLSFTVVLGIIAVIILSLPFYRVRNK